MRRTLSVLLFSILFAQLSFASADNCEGIADGSTPIPQKPFSEYTSEELEAMIPEAREALAVLSRTALAKGLEARATEPRDFIVPDYFYAFFVSMDRSAAKFMGYETMYVSQRDRELYRLRFKDGKFYILNRNYTTPGFILHLTEELADTAKGKHVIPGIPTVTKEDGRAAFVMDAHGEIFILLDRQDGRWHHTSLLGEVPIYAAGEIIIEGGVIKYFDNNSGHYKPGPESNEQIKQVLMDRYGIDFYGTMGESSNRNKIQLPISGAIKNTEKMPFMPQVGPDTFENYLMQNIPFEPLTDFHDRVQRLMDQSLLRRNVGRIVVITALEYDQVLKEFIPMEEINEIALENNIQRAAFEILGLGRGQITLEGKPEQTFFIVVASNELLQIRRKVHARFVEKGGNPEAFNPEHFFPHITLGFTSRDLYLNDGVVKDKTSVFLQIFEKGGK
jgi:hypothetical protein